MMISSGEGSPNINGIIFFEFFNRYFFDGEAESVVNVFSLLLQFQFLHKTLPNGDGSRFPHIFKSVDGPDGIKSLMESTNSLFEILFDPALEGCLAASFGLFCDDWFLDFSSFDKRAADRSIFVL